ncbi:MAG: bifunctional transaldolase/phosoglucose isomerase [Chromatiaceae bacterium]|nr:bifunctional transaldolase/phosoglucose isomerase [Chromatiaceae bacterium]MCP5314482.1 bifunctional transaldolase/phosoglucose isomerase [Chromatiaceae bacterium]
MNPIKTLTTLGQAVWLDYIRRGLLDSGGLEKLIQDDGISGVTSNPAIFQKAIAGSRDYASAIAAIAHQQALDDEGVYERLAIADVQRAADLLRPVYQKSKARDGYVSLEVSPRLAMNVSATCAAARRLWKEVDRPNLMIKVPATPAGIEAVEELVAEGLNVNVTLLFSLMVYEQVAECYLRGLERRRHAGLSLEHTVSVASFFLSRIDTAVDARIKDRVANGPGDIERSMLEAAAGQTAVACARLAYQRWRQIFNGPRWDALAAAGARPQRLLWASTSTKNPAYDDIRYVEMLVGQETVNTVPPATLDAYRDHGRPRLTLETGLDAAAHTLENLDRVGIDLAGITDTLLNEGLEQFNTAYSRLLDTVSAARKQAIQAPIDHQTLHLPAALDARLGQLLKEWHEDRTVDRLWSRDATLWTGRGENQWLEWLDIVPAQIGRLADLRSIGHLFEGQYFEYMVLLGMGGSSLAAEVFGSVFGSASAHPSLIVLDGTDPDQTLRVERAIDLDRTLFIVSSKSGTTLEPDMLADYFLDRLTEKIGEQRAPLHFIAITDPGSPLERRALARGFRAVYHGRRGIGGRYSALSDFGMVPASMLGIDLERFLERTAIMVEACAVATPAAENPAVVLGLCLGAARQAGWDKVTFIATPGIESLGGWLEQLLAESTGKFGTGLIPVNGEEPGVPESYGEDRLFVQLRLATEHDPEQDAVVDHLVDAGHPVVRIDITDQYDLGQEFFRWEFATAVAGAVMHLNPFDQPDVEGAKLAARQIATGVRDGQPLPDAKPLACRNDLSLYAGDGYAEILSNRAGHNPTFGDLLDAHLRQLQPGDYFALLAYLDRGDEQVATLLQAIRHRVRDRCRVATCLGYGPRYLHATGQVYKGGPATGVFLMLTRDVIDDIASPGRQLRFGITQTAQALADQNELIDRGRRIVRVHLGRDPVTGLEELTSLVLRTKAG